MSTEKEYLLATRHPWPCFLYLLPLLLAYEMGVLYLGGSQPDLLRNGADNWCRQGLGAIGLQQQFWAPAFLVLVLLIWNYLRRNDRPGDLLGVLSGMGIESVAFALGLWGISRGLGPLIDALGVQLTLSPTANPALAQVVTFLGAGIYEETLFRLLLFSGLIWLLSRWDVPMPLVIGFSAMVSATLFSASHHFGPYGEAFDGYTFLFRTIAGVYFSLIYHFRGFGITVGAHACYDVVVGVMVG